MIVRVPVAAPSASDRVQSIGVLCVLASGTPTALLASDPPVPANVNVALAGPPDGTVPS